MRKFLLIGCLLAALVLTSCEQSTSGEIEAAPRVANPKADVSVTADVPFGTGVMLSTTTEGALIYYTLNDETVPTSGAERLYTEGKLVSLGNTEGEVTLRAIAVKPGWGNSDTEIWTYKVTSTAVPVPTV
ncbi:MAG: chitobiase/beta-hexosaminidase C-terminal domain-containing protein, partial [Spirochaetaceae bacterium]|nr:chitobiase/beta-hexosaminidase C-terminal domain-containing protein [Spirochaetaceae bacterium]